MKILKYVLKVIAILFAAFHHFLPKMAPPEEVRQSSSVGLASFILVIIFLLAAFLARRYAHARYRKWMCAVSLFCGVVGIISFFVYLGETSRLTFRFPPGEQHAELYVKGEALTPDAATWIANHPGKTDSELADSFGGVNFKERVWTHDSIGKAEIALAKLYTLFVVSLTSAVLFLSEGLLVSSKEKSAS